MIAIIDYDAGNIKSVEKALQFLHQESVVTRDLAVIRQASGAILPGVGAFGDAMGRLVQYGLVPVIRDFVLEQKKPFLGICLGQQLLFEGSEESGGVEGLSLLKGHIRRIPDENGTRKVPHIGWNSLEFTKKGKLFSGIPEGSFVYFVHSFYLDGDLPCVAARTEYGVKIGAAVEQDNLFSCQFHPEKSSDVGLRILSNFCMECKS